jgi:tyrosine-protein kinase Etk/Wzc
MSKHGDVALEVLPGAPQGRLPDELLPPPEPGDDEPSLREYLDVLVGARKLIVAAVVAAAALGGAYALLATPVYRSDALVQVEDHKAGTGLLGDLTAAFGDSTPAEAEIEILRSRAIVGDAVDGLRLDLVARPRRFPLLGGFLARRHDAEGGVAAAFLGLSSFGWGGEQLKLDRLDLPDRLYGKPLTLVAGDGGRYTLRDPDGQTVLEGEVGKAAAGNGAGAFVAELVARPGTEFRVARLRRDTAISDLQEQLRISEKGKKTGILQLALEGDDPARVAAILDSLSRAYVRRNVERKSAEAEKTLAFLEAQLPELRGNLDAAETEYESYRARKGGVDVSLETQAAVTRAVEIEKALSEVQVEYAALRLKFTETHPALVALANKIRRLDSERATLDERLKKLPEAEMESARRMRDVKVANELYLMLLNKAQELKVVKEGTIGNVRILDAAIVPVEPVAPKRARVLALALFLGLAGGVGLAFARRAFDQGVEDPEALERATGIGVHASVPFSERQVEADRRARRERVPVPILADVDPKDLAVESLRSLRTSLQFALFEASSGIVSLSGPAPAVGKSFVSANLAHLLGEAGKQVVVVDADLRRGHLHEYYGTDRARGLSDVIGGHVSVDEAIRPTSSNNVRFLPTGTVPPNPAELLSSERFARLLQELAGRFEIVLLDTPPILAVTDAAVIGRHASVNLLVLRAGEHPLREIAASLRAFARGGVRVHGLVLNGVHLDRGLGRRNGYHYQYRYG